MGELLSNIQLEQLATAVGFIAYLIYQNWELKKDIRSLASEKNQLADKYIQSIHESNRDLNEAVRTFDRLLQARGQ